MSAAPPAEKTNIHARQVVQDDVRTPERRNETDAFKAEHHDVTRITENESDHRNERTATRWSAKPRLPTPERPMKIGLFIATQAEIIADSAFKPPFGLTESALSAKESNARSFLIDHRSILASIRHRRGIKLTCRAQRSGRRSCGVFGFCRCFQLPLLNIHQRTRVRAHTHRR